MSISYLSLDIGVHGLQIHTYEELQQFKSKLRSSIEELIVEFGNKERGVYSSDIDLDIMETAGKIDVDAH